MIVRTATELGALIRDTRRRAGLSQAALAKRLGTSQGWVSEVENGKPTAEIAMVLRLLAHLDIQLDARRPGIDPERSQGMAEAAQAPLFFDLDQDIDSVIDE